MKLPGNNISQISRYFHEALKLVYEASEIDAIIREVLSHFLKKDFSSITSIGTDRVNESDLVHIYNCLEELKSGKPLQYILKSTFFYNLNFIVSENVLIPRPETEELVDLIIKESKDTTSLMDIGTGSGCMAISIGKKLKIENIIACDISAEALAIAQQNARSHQLKVKIINANILNTNEFILAINERVDVIVSNPPYILLNEKTTLHKNVVDFEPRLALFVDDDDPILFYKKIIDVCFTVLNKNGKLFFELNPLTAKLVSDYALQSNLFKTVEILKDMSGNERFLRAISKN
jgi:release factor glutamine methyltransferase